MPKPISLLAVLFFSYTASFSQPLTFTTFNYRDLSIPYIESDPSYYQFNYPILADILDSTNFSPPDDGVYWKADFGHRYLAGRATKTDNHGGFDYWQDHTYNGTVYNDTNRVPIICMCDGYISEVITGSDSVLELTATGRSVQVTCDSSFQSFGNAIQINYRHLSSLGDLPGIADTAAGTISIQKGDTIGKMGESGTTTNVHLHLSVQTLQPEYGNAIVNTARLFDPTQSPGVLAPLVQAQIQLLQDWPDSALIRVIWPFNQTINQFEFVVQDTIVFNKEEAYETGSTIRDNHDCLPGVKVFAYQFNGKQTAQARYLSEMGNMPAIYPASPNRDTSLAQYGYPHIPITHPKVAHVYDFVIHNLPPGHQTADIWVKVSDVWGYTVEGTLIPFIGIDSPLELQVQIFPNPTNGQLQVTIDEPGIKNMNLYDLAGKLVLRKTAQELETTMDIDHLPNGIYILQIRSADRGANIKVVKE